MDFCFNFSGSEFIIGYTPSDHDYVKLISKEDNTKIIIGVLNKQERSELARKLIEAASDLLSE